MTPLKNRKYFQTLRGTNFSLLIPYALVGSDAAGKVVAVKMGSAIRDLCNRWAFSDLSWHIRSLIVSEAYRMVTGNTHRPVPQPTFVGRENTESANSHISVNIRYLEKATGVSQSVKYKFLPYHLPKDLGRLPQAPADTKYLTVGSFVLAEEPKSCKPKDLPDEWTDETFAAAEQYMRFFSSVADGLVATKKGLDGLWNFYLKGMGGKTSIGGKS